MWGNPPAVYGNQRLEWTRAFAQVLVDANVMRICQPQSAHAWRWVIQRWYMIRAFTGVGVKTATPGPNNMHPIKIQAYLIHLYTVVRRYICIYTTSRINFRFLVWMCKFWRESNKKIFNLLIVIISWIYALLVVISSPYLSTSLTSYLSGLSIHVLGRFKYFIYKTSLRFFWCSEPPLVLLRG